MDAEEISRLFEQELLELDTFDDELEEDEDADGVPDDSKPQNKHSREKLDEFIRDFNAMFTTNHSTKEFYSYYKDIGKRV